MPRNRALQQIEDIIAHLRAKQSADCSLAEAEDTELVRLNTLRFTLQPDNERMFRTIAELHRRYFPETHK